MTFTLNPLKKLIKKHGGKRVSDDACKELSKYLESQTAELAKEAAKIAKHAGRKTIMRHDVKIARKVLER
jgi:histone H3/H4